MTITAYRRALRNAHIAAATASIVFSIPDGLYVFTIGAWLLRDPTKTRLRAEALAAAFGWCSALGVMLAIHAIGAASACEGVIAMLSMLGGAGMIFFFARRRLKQ